MRTPALALIAAIAGLPAFADPAEDAAQTYVAIASAEFDDSLATAQVLQEAVAALIAGPSEMTLSAAREAWKTARVPYVQTEAFRFTNPILDDREGRLNAWPLDEGLIDYVDAGYGQSEENALSTLNVIATPEFTLSGVAIDATQITPALISDTLFEADGIEGNVASGYHAIEFLLWGQDLNGTGPGSGARPYTDYAAGAECTNENCDRRAAYLSAVTTLLISDLTAMSKAWAKGGDARAAVLADPGGIGARVLTSMGSLSYGELAGQRMRLGLMLGDPEEEEDCFSDNTHNSHYYNGIGIRNLYLGRYERVDGTIVSGPSVADMVATTDPALDAQLRGELDTSVAALAAIKAEVEGGGMAYDQMLAAGNQQGKALIMGGVDALIAQTATIERASKALGAAAGASDGAVFE